MAERSDSPLLAVDGLRTVFRTGAGAFPAVDGISFTVRAGKTLAIVGESGSGKSVTALSIMRLVPDPPGRIVAGTISFSKSQEVVQNIYLRKATSGLNKVTGVAVANLADPGTGCKLSS